MNILTVLCWSSTCQVTLETKKGSPGMGWTWETLPHSSIVSNPEMLHVYLAPVNQVSTVGSKWQFIQNMDIITATHCQTRLKSWLLTDGQPIHPDTILKHTHSESGNHIIFPDSKCYERTWKYLKCNSEVSYCKWFCQTFIHLLRTYGEWCIIIVGSSPAYTVHTQLLPWDMYMETNSGVILLATELAAVCLFDHSL